MDLISGAIAVIVLGGVAYILKRALDKEIDKLK